MDGRLAAGKIEVPLSTGTVDYCGIAFSIVFGAIYLASWLFVRRNHIVLPAQRKLLAFADSIEARIVTDQDQPATETPEEAALKRQILELLRKARRYAGVRDLDIIDRQIGGRGRLLAGWILIHEAETVLPLLLPENRVAGRLKMLIGELRCTDSNRLKALGKYLQDQLDRTVQEGAAPGEIRGLLQGGFTAYFHITEQLWTEKVALQNQTLWIITIGMVFLISLAGAGNGMYLLLGGLGGFVSRLTRVIEPRVGKFLQPGVHWTTLFLSPVLGALAGWTGMLVISGLIQLGQLGGILAITGKPLPAAEPAVYAAAWSLAFVLGFSERTFTGAVGALCDSLNTSHEGDPKPASRI